jgi:hypothetical protein
MKDTSPEMRKKQSEIIFRLSPDQRFEQGLEMIDFARRTVENSIMNQNPDISPLELKIAVFLRYYSRDFSAIEKQRIIEHFKKIS